MTAWLEVPNLAMVGLLCPSLFQPSGTWATRIIGLCWTFSWSTPLMSWLRNQFPPEKLWKCPFRSGPEDLYLFLQKGDHPKPWRLCWSRNCTCKVGCNSNKNWNCRRGKIRLKPEFLAISPKSSWTTRKAGWPHFDSQKTLKTVKRTTPMLSSTLNNPEEPRSCLEPSQGGEEGKIPAQPMQGRFPKHTFLTFGKFTLVKIKCVWRPKTWKTGVNSIFRITVPLDQKEQFGQKLPMELNWPEQKAEQRSRQWAEQLGSKSPKWRFHPGDNSQQI